MDGKVSQGKIVLPRPNSCIIWFTDFSFDSPTFLHKMHRFATLFIGFLCDSVTFFSRLCGLVTFFYMINKLSKIRCTDVFKILIDFSSEDTALYACFKWMVMTFYMTDFLLPEDPQICFVWLTGFSYDRVSGFRRCCGLTT